MSDDMPAPQPLAAIVEQHKAAMGLLAKIHDAFVRDTDGGHYAYFGGGTYDEIKAVLGISKSTVVGC